MSSAFVFMLMIGLAAFLILFVGGKFSFQTRVAGPGYFIFSLRYVIRWGRDISGNL